ncbi:MAG: hypothetical protein JXA96_05200 [Sedimentisphaerales bacterium]|nr:hypothetical protein [Sedimentisphaerales bacterium]
MNKIRENLILDLQQARNSVVLIYFTGDRRGLETKIGTDAFDLFTKQLDLIGDAPKITLFLYTRGGDVLAAWSVINLIHQFCKELEIIVPSKCHSSGTLMCLAAKNIIMTKQATLGPIDPSIHNQLNPAIPGAPPTAKAPVSVEDINAFIDFAKSVSGDKNLINQAFQRLSSEINPLVLGNAFRARGQIRMLAKKLMSNNQKKKKVVENILRFLCSESGSHDYTINRKEAKDGLKLPIEKPDDALYSKIIALYNDISDQLELLVPFDPQLILGQNTQAPYSFSRAIIESVPGRTDIFMTDGSLIAQQLQTPQGIQKVISDNRTFEGWRHYV